MDQKIT